MFSESNLQGIYTEKRGRKLLFATKNLALGRSVYGEELVREGKEEFRIWDPSKSKLCSGLLKGMTQCGVKPGYFVLYLGASSGTTVSHVSDIVGNGGGVFAVE